MFHLTLAALSEVGMIFYLLSHEASTIGEFPQIIVKSGTRFTERLSQALSSHYDVDKDIIDFQVEERHSGPHSFVVNVKFTDESEYEETLFLLRCYEY